MSNNDLMNGKQITLGSRTILTAVGVFIVSLLLVFWMGTCHNADTWDANYKNYRDSVQVEAAKSQLRTDSIIESQQIVIDSSTARIVVLDDSLSGIENQIVRVAQQNDSLSQEVLNSLPEEHRAAVEELVTSFGRQIGLLKTQIEVFKDLVVEKDNIIRSTLIQFEAQTLRADNLQLTIDNMPEPRKPPLLFGFLHISPTTAFLAGSVTTIGAILIMTRK